MNIETEPAWELAIEKLATTINDKIDRLASVTFERFERIERRLDQLTTMHKNVEIQIDHIVSALNPRNSRGATQQNRNKPERACQCNKL